ncbi:hypothetical protein BpHYR1_014228 [Brachionus plicatilis]|uniref:Uncharacterized protein n=1 Tax=Brachionus plicatilis TaxID=10195 RepID=A0A3M7SBP9_BRAPC|nr:hypothetical protein BpHYR1_014228 [Brachionus plicatilis]
MNLLSVLGKEEGSFLLIVILIKNRNLACAIPFSAFRIPPFRDNPRPILINNFDLRKKLMFLCNISDKKQIRLYNRCKQGILQIILKSGDA